MVGLRSFVVMLYSIFRRPLDASMNCWCGGDPKDVACLYRAMPPAMHDALIKNWSLTTSRPNCFHPEISRVPN